MITAHYTGTLVSEVCYGTVFGMEQDFRSNRLRDHKSFYCPNGHSQAYTGKTEEQKLREQLEAAQRAKIRTREALDQERRSHAATKGVLTKTRKRAVHGVCPGCKRSFANVAAHVANQHPELKAAVG